MTNKQKEIKMRRKYIPVSILLALLSIVAFALPDRASGVEYFLRADTVVVNLPGGVNVTMWGFALENAFGETSGTVVCPGPELVVPPGDNVLTIHLDNNLPEATSIVIPGLTATMTPVRRPDGRVRSFTHETPSGNSSAVDYTWNDVKPGTYIYHSGTHPGKQVQMGLYGVVRKSFSEDGSGGKVYENVDYDSQKVIFFSEIDPVLHEAVANEEYGPGLTVTSPIGYKAKFFLINGKVYVNGDTALPIGSPGQTILLRLVNAGLKTHAPMINGLETLVVAEDGKPYKYPEKRFSMTLPAMKTKDVLITPSAAGTYVLYDRRLYLTNSGSAPGGMYLKLSVND